jgi:hypothetical protein
MESREKQRNRDKETERQTVKRETGTYMIPGVCGREVGGGGLSLYPPSHLKKS